MTTTLRPHPRPAAPLLAAVAVALAVASLGAPWAVAVAVGAAGAAAIIDLRVGVLPDRLLAAGAMPILVAVAVADPPFDAIAVAIVGATVFAAPLLALHLASPASLGFGDVKLGAMLGAALGLADPALGLVALCAGSAVSVAAAVLRRRRSIALGPGLAFGTIAAVAMFGATGGSWR